MPDIAAILDCLGEPAILLSKDYRILMANDAYRRHYGDGTPLRRRLCYEVSHNYSVPCDLAGETCPLKNTRETGQPTRVLHVHHTPRGPEYVNVEMRPIRSSDGELEYFVEVMHPSNIATTDAAADGLVGRSSEFQRMLEAVDRVAPSQTSVLLLGESGTGKEVIARTIHERSARAGDPFVVVECTGLADALFESELFGHVKGAFTGASTDKIGLVESANGGTLFLDEIGDVTLAQQVKLLRLLETGQFRRVGSTEDRMADFRLVCATNKNLAALVAEGAFREDLYYRLNVFEIELPPLRRRGEDLALLVESLLRRLAPGRDVRVARRTLERLAAYRFPGNIRELRNVVERALLMCDGDRILPRHLPERVRAASDGAVARPRTLAEVEEDYLRGVLAGHSGDRRSLAEQLGISERALYRKLARLRGSA